MRVYRLLFTLYFVPLLVLAQQTPGSKPVYDEQYAQQFQFDRYSTEKGVLLNKITRIRKQNGYIWMCPDNHQLIRFDGVNFVNVSFHIEGKLFRKNAYFFFLDSKKGIWISTSTGLYWCKDSEALQRSRRVPNSASLELKKIPWKFLKANQYAFVSGEDKQGNLWIAPETARTIYRYTPQTNQFKAYPIANGNLVASWRQDKNGQIWVLTEKELYRFNPQSQLFEPLSIVKTLGLPKDVLCSRLLDDRQGNLWLSTDRFGVFQLRFKPDRPTSTLQLDQVKHFLFNYVWSMTQDRSGRIWFGSTTEGLCLYEYANQTCYRVQFTNRETNKKIQSSNVYSILIDDTDKIWIGHWNDGLYAYDPHRLQFTTLTRNKQTITGPNLTWIAHKQGDSLYVYEEEKKKIQVYSIFQKKYTGQLPPYTQSTGCLPGTVLQDERGIIWTVNETGACTYNSARKVYDFYPISLDLQSGHRINNGYFRAVLITKNSLTTNRKNQEIWVGLSGGLARFDIGLRQWLNNTDFPDQLTQLIYNKQVQSIIAGADHTIWLGVMETGLIRYNQQSGKVDVWDAQKQDISTFVPFFEDQSSIWVCTENGLYELSHKDLSIKAHYSQETGTLPSNVFDEAIKGSNGHFWLISAHELIDFVPGKGAVRVYSFIHDLNDEIFSIDQDKYGTLYLQGKKGITYFHPDQLQATFNRFVPPVKITGITVMDSSYAPNLKELTLPHDQNFIAFDFVALNFASPEKNQYQYKLEGVDDNWVKAGTNRTANYTKLVPGTYVFRVIGSNNDGVWNKTGASVTLTIRPPWWGTWWFRLLLVVLLVAGIYGLFRYRLQQILRQRETEIKASLMAQESERQRFSRELHDGVGANLSLLKMYLSSFGNPDIPMDTLKDRSESLLASSVEDIRRLIHDMHPRNLQELGLVRAVEEMVQVVNLSKRVQVSFAADGLPPSLPEPVEINLYRIIQELLQNAVKHARASHICLQLSYQADKLQLSYSDNGQGFDPAVASSGNGLLNIRNRVELLKGKVDIQSVKGEGTTVNIETRLSSQCFLIKQPPLS